MTRRIRAFSILVAVCLAATAAWTQGENPPQQRKPPIYTYVSQWAVPRAQWPDMVKLNQQGRAAMDKYVADGTLVSHGEFESLVHTEGEPTHGTWFSASSVANIMKVLTGLMSQPSSIAPVLANSKHWDLFLVTRTYNGRPEKVQGGFLVGASFELKPGREQQFSEIVRGKIVPLLDKLVSDGTILSYSVERQEIIKEKSNLITFVYIAPDASGIDKVDAALENEIGKDPAFGPAFDAAVKSGVEHDFLSRIVYINYK